MGVTIPEKSINLKEMVDSLDLFDRLPVALLPNLVGGEVGNVKIRLPGGIICTLINLLLRSIIWTDLIIHIELA